eukprot:738446_1
MDCCEGLICYDGTCTTCTEEGDTCGDDLADCCEGLTCYEGMCVACTEEGETCGDDYADCCDDMICGGSNTCYKPNGALSLFNMNFSLKHLVGFAVVIMATGLL